MRLTDNKVAEELKSKERTQEEEIYLKLAFFESEMERKRLYTRRDLNMCITKAMESLANALKDKLVELGVSELEKVAIDGKVSIEEVKKVGDELDKV